MIEDVDLKDFFTKEEIRDLLKKELERQNMLHGTQEATEDEFEATTTDSDITVTKKALEISQDFPSDAHDIPDSTHLLASFGTLDQSSERTSLADNRLNFVADSLLDVRLERLKKTEEMLPNVQKMRYNINRTRRNRFDLYFCYVVYFTMVFLSFAFAIYVWTPIVKGLTYGRPKRNISYFKHNGFNGYQF